MLWGAKTSAMFLKTSFTTLIVGVFVVYVLHTCWVMYGIVYTKPCDSPKSDKCIAPFLAGNPKLQVPYTDLQDISSVATQTMKTFMRCVNARNICVSVCPVEYLHCTAAQCRGRTHPDPQRRPVWCEQQVWEVWFTLLYQIIMAKLGPFVSNSYSGNKHWIIIKSKLLLHYCYERVAAIKYDQVQ